MNNECFYLMIEEDFHSHNAVFKINESYCQMNKLS